LKLGALTLAWDPDLWTIPDAKQVVMEQETYTSHFMFLFGAKIIGKKIVLEWEWMSQEQFDAMDDLFQADVPLLWNPEEVSDPRTFMVEFAGLDGSLFDVALWDQSNRKDVKATLIVLEMNEAVLS
jgi:hypothetical protein